MNIKIYQRGGDKQNHELYRKALNFYATKLLAPEEREKITVKLQIVNLSYLGWAEASDVKDEYIIKIGKAENFITNIYTLAHEAVHLKQMVKGEFKRCEKFYMWKRKKYIQTTEFDDTLKQGDYPDYPWEKEPERREKSLAKAFFKYMEGLSQKTIESLTP